MNSKGRSILIILIAGIGDLVLASKSIRAIRNGNPYEQIHLLTSAEAVPIASNYDYLDHVWAFPFRELRRNNSQIFNILRLIPKLKKTDFYSAANLYRISSRAGAIRMGILFLLLRAKIKIGHDHKGFKYFLNKRVPPETFQNRHFTDSMMDIAQLAGGIPDGKGIEVFWDKKSEKRWEHLFSRKTKSIGNITIGINPGADRSHKRWNPDYYADVADRLSEDLNAKILILGGPGEEKISSHIQDKMKNRPINLGGQLTLNDLVYIIGQLDLLVTNDSGPMHIAAAVKTPLVAIFGPEEPVYTRPYTTENLYRIVHKDVDCRPCKKKNCKRPVCLDLITPEEVMEKCFEMLPIN